MNSVLKHEEDAGKVRHFQNKGLRKRSGTYQCSCLRLMDGSNSLLLASNDVVDSAATKRLQWAEVGSNDCLMALILLTLQAVELDELKALSVDEEEVGADLSTRDGLQVAEEHPVDDGVAGRGCQRSPKR